MTASCSTDFPIFWIPACAGKTINNLISDRYHRRHAREGGYPVFKTTFYGFIQRIFKKIQPRQNGELCANRPKIALRTKKINLDNKTSFG